MKPRRYALNLYLCLPLLLVFAVGLSGCDKPKRLIFRPVPNRSVLALSADDIVQVMSRVGFSDEQIIEYGPGLRSALLNSGACKIEQGETIQAVFAVEGDYVYVSTRSVGSFIYNVKKDGLESEFRAPKPEVKQPMTPSVVPADGSKGARPPKTVPTGNKALKLKFFES
jgi:hypothetical protein